MKPVNILYLNPLSDPDYNKPFADSLAGYKYASTDLDVASLRPTPDLPVTLDELGFRAYESLIVGPTVQAARLGSIPQVKRRYGAMVIGCFYDPALLEARGISGNMKVVGPCQASCQVATNLANTFSIIIGMDYWKDQMRENVYHYGYKDYLTSFENINIPASQLPVNPAKTLKAIQTASADAVRKGAEAIILGCTLETGTFKEVEQYLYDMFKQNIPVIDPSIAALKTAEHLAINNDLWPSSQIHGMQPPPESDLKKYGIFQTPYSLAHVINVAAG